MSATPETASRRMTVDWVYVRYRTVVLIALTAIILAAAGYFWYTRYHATDERRALAAISEAESTLNDARSRIAGNEVLTEASDLLASARTQLQSDQFVDARETAESATGLARGALSEVLAQRDLSVRIVRRDGDVRIKRAGQFLWESASDDMVLREGDQIRTGGGGTAQLDYPDGRSTIGPGTLLEIRELQRDTDRRSQRISSRLAWGSLRASIDENSKMDSVHEVSTDAAAVRSQTPGEFEVSHDREGGKSSITSYGGSVVVRTGKSDFELEANSRVALSRGRVIERSKVLESPRLLSPPNQKTFLVRGEGPIVVSWESMESAQRYQLQVSSRWMFTDRAVDEDRLETTAYTLPQLAPATYYWRVRSFDRSGNPGRWSDAIRFRVVEADLADIGDKTPPPLAVDEILVVGTNAIVTGRSEPGALVWINEERVEVNGDGGFRWMVKLTVDGKNTLRFLAQDAAGNETKKVGYAYVEGF